MHNWFKLRRNRRGKLAQTRRSDRRKAQRLLFSESLEKRILLAVVTGENPVAGSHNALVSTDVSATFDEAIQAATATTDNFIVQSEQSGGLGAAEAVVTVDGMTVTLNPNNDFFPGDLVRVTATSGIQGTSAAVPRVWQFRTAVGGGSGIFADTGQTVGAVGNQFGTLGDIDGDGDVDALQGGTGLLSLNDGTGIFTDSGQRVTAGGEVEFGDVDGDGDPDVVGTSGVWLNDGNGVFTNTGANLGGGGSVELGDVDGDGDLDVMKAGPGYAGDQVWLNNGSGSFANTGQVLGSGSTQSTESADFDGDGDLDFFVVINGGTNTAWINDGTGVFTSNTQALGGFGSSIDVDLGDLDGDGDIDAIVANNPQTSNGSHVFLNDGTGIFVQTPQNLGPTENNWSIELGDVDGDGDLDAVVANLNQPSRIWLNDGSGTFTDSGQGMDNVRSYGMDIADLDGDGDLDIYFAGNSQPSRVWINQNLSPDVALSIDNAAIAEDAGTATVTATIAAAHTAEVTVGLGFSGTATDTADYTTSGAQIVIPIGATSGSVTITAVQDALNEADETVVVDTTTITNGQGGGQVTTTITDDDDPPTLALAIDNAAIAEAGGSAVLTATISAVSGQDVTVDLGVTGTVAAEDFTLSATQIVIPAGSTSGSATLTAVDDGVDEPDETVIVDVTAVAGATEDGTQQVTATITDDDDPPTVALSVDNTSIEEDGGVASITVTMSAASLTDTTVNLAVSGTATNTTDYTISATQVVIPAGSTSGSVAVTSVADLLITEGPETVIVDIDTITGNATEDGVQQVTATIIDDVNGPDITIAVDTNTIAEGGGVATVTATLASAFGLPVTIDLGLTGTATGGGTDYMASATQIVVPVGATSGSATITAVDDALTEGDETVVVDVTAVTNGNESGDQQETIAITDDETPPTVTLGVDTAAIAEAGGVAVFTATLSAATTLDVTVDLAASGTATAAADYNLSGTQIVIAAGQTTGSVTATAVDDTLDDDDETIVLDIDTVTNATEDGTQQATTTITDDDEAPPIPPGPFPAANSLDSAQNTVVAYNFGQTVTAATDQTFVVNGSTSVGQLTGGATTLTLNGSVATHTPAEAFHAGELVNATVTAGISLSGGATTPFVWQFRAGSGGSGQFEDGGVTFGQHALSHIAVGDIDDDGDLDAIRAGDQTWLNDGSGAFTNSGQNLGGGLGEFSFADVDGDGDLDIAGGRIMLNDGTGNFTNSGTSPGGTQTRAGDLDGDGDLDLFLGIRYGGNQIWFNDGNGGFTNSGQGLGNHSTDAVELGDFDNDGDLDAFEGNNGTANIFWMNDGTGVFSQGQSVGGFRATKDVAVGDIDGDGDLDAIGGNVYSNTGARIYRNEGGVFVETGQVLGGATAQIYRVRTADMDGDGDLDIIPFQRFGAGTEIWLNDGSGIFADSGQRLTFSGGARRIDFAEIGDIDGDGDVDLLEANVRGDGPGSRVWFNQNLQPTVALSVDNATIAEDAGIATITATLSGVHTADVTVDLETSGTATATDDYTASATQIVIPVGATTGSITVTAVQDTVDDDDETVVVDISNVTNGDEAGAQQVSVTIVDDDEPVMPDVSISVDNADIPEEAGVATFTVSLSEATTLDVTVDLAVSGTAAAGDFTISGTQVVIAAGQTSGSVTVTAVQDTDDEDDETVIVDIDTVANGNEAGTQQATTTITDDDGPASFAVGTFAGTSTGFMAQLSAAIDTADLNLYDTSAGLGVADVTLTGAAGGAVTGSLVADGDMVYFIATGGVLAADAYTATLRSAADGFEDTTGRLLDGDGDGTGGDNYVGNFTIEAPAGNAVTLSVADFVRGPGQPVNLPANATTGLPLTISEGAGVRNVTVSIDYDPALLDISAATVGANMPAGAAVTLDTSTAGTAVLTFTSPADLPAGANTLVNLTASVPNTDGSAIYLRSQTLNIHSASVTDASAASIPVIDDDGLHVVEFFADVSGNGRVNAADASQVAQLAALIIDGFANTPSTDPAVVADVSGNGRVNAADASQVAQAAALLPVDNIPEIPAGGLTSSIVTPIIVDTPNTNPTPDANADAAFGGDELGFVDNDLGLAASDEPLTSAADIRNAMDAAFEELFDEDLLASEGLVSDLM